MNNEKIWKEIEEAETRIAHARVNGDWQEEGNALIALGLCLQEIEQFGEAITSLERALNLLRPFEDIVDEMLVLRALGTAYFAGGKAAQAFAAFDEALTLARLKQNGEAEFACLYHLGIAATTLEKTHTAISSFQQALTIARLQEQKNDEIHTLGVLGAAYMRAGHAQEAITCHEQARTLALQVGDLDSVAYELGNLGSVYASVLGQVEEGTRYYQQAFNLFQQLEDHANCAKTLANIGRVLSNAKRVQDALPYLEQARSLALQLGDRVLLSSILNTMGDAEEASEDITAAFRLHEQAVEVARGKGDRKQEEQSLNELALLWKRRGYLQKALSLHQEALSLAQARQDPLAEARLLGNISLVLDEAENHTLALLLHKQALLLFQFESDLLGEGRTWVYMAISAFYQKRNAKGLAFLRIGQILLHESHTREEELILPTIEKLHRHLGEAKFRRSWQASEYHLRRIHFQRHWFLLGMEPLEGESGSSLNPCLCAMGETWLPQVSSQEMLAEWQEAKALIDPEAWRTIFTRPEAKYRGKPDEILAGASRVSLLVILGCTYAETGYLGKAQQKFEQALALARELGDRETQQKLLFTLSCFLQRIGRLEKASTNFNEAFFLLRTFEENQLLMIRSYRRMGVTFRLFDSPRLALFYLGEARKAAHIGRNLFEEGWALSELGETSAELGHTQKAMSYHQQALTIFQQQHEHTWELEQLLRLARVQAFAGKWTEAEKKGKHAQAVAQQQENWAGVLRASIFLGILALLQENREGYVQHFRLAMSMVHGEEKMVKTRIQHFLNQRWMM